MINGAHVILYSRDADADRAFIRDVLGFPGVDAGGGWLIFQLPPAEVAVHPAGGPSHELYLMCDDIERTLAELTAKGVRVSPAQDAGWGVRASITLPSGSELAIYQPRHATAAGDLPERQARRPHGRSSTFRAAGAGASGGAGARG